MRPPTGNFQRDDEDWLRHFGIAPYDEQELDYVLWRLWVFDHDMSQAAKSLTRSAKGAAAAIDELADALAPETD